MNSRASWILAGLVAAGLAALVFWFYWTPERALRGRAVDRRTVALRVLAEQIARSTPQAQVLVLSNPFSRLPNQPREVHAFETAAVGGLKAGWGDQVRLVGVVFPELQPAAARDPSSLPIPPDATTPLSFMTTDQAWDRLLAAYPSADVVVSLIGLPANLRECQFWRQPKPKLALLLPDLRLIGATSEIVDAFHTGKIAAAILNRPGAPPESESVRADYKAEFARRFVLVTGENVTAIQEAFPGLIP